MENVTDRFSSTVAVDKSTKASKPAVVNFVEVVIGGEMGVTGAPADVMTILNLLFVVIAGLVIKEPTVPFWGEDISNLTLCPTEGAVTKME